MNFNFKSAAHLHLLLTEAAPGFAVGLILTLADAISPYGFAASRASKRVHLSDADAGAWQHLENQRCRPVHHEGSLTFNLDRFTGGELKLPNAGDLTNLRCHCNGFALGGASE
jgi:hypothetical protein